MMFDGPPRERIAMGSTRGPARPVCVRVSPRRRRSSKLIARLRHRNARGSAEPEVDADAATRRCPRGPRNLDFSLQLEVLRSPVLGLTLRSAAGAALLRR